MKILITGAAGFVGYHLAHYVNQLGNVEILALDRHFQNPQSIALPANLQKIECNLLDRTKLFTIVRETQPDRIFHLAAQSFVPHSWENPAETFEINITGTLNILEAARPLADHCRIQIAGSSEEYGLVTPENCPITENQPFRPVSPYAVSKIGQDMLGYQYAQSYRMPIIRTRAFNHAGPYQSACFVIPSFARQIARIEAGLIEPIIRVGELSTIRDFSDVRDIVRGYWLALEKGQPGEVYNLASGHGLTISDVLQKLLSLSDHHITVKTDPQLRRPSDIPQLVGDSTKLQLAAGWSVQIPFMKTLRDTLDFWRAQTDAE